MIDFIKSYSIRNMKYKLTLLYTLNVTDILFTLLLVGTGYYVEANALMATVIQNPTAGIALKVLLPASLILYLYFRMRRATDTQLRRANLFINVITIIYALINVSHLVWVILLPVYSA